MKSFQNFANNIVEAERKAYGSPSGYGPGGEPMYTRRPGPNEPGRRAQVQRSPQSVASVKSDIEAAKGFGGVRSGGLETRTVPSSVTQIRQARAAAAGTPDPWFSKKGGRTFNFTPQDIERATTKIPNPMRAKGGSQAFADFIDDFAKTNKIPKSSALRQAIEIPDTQTTFKKIFGQALRSQRRAQLQNPSQPRQLGLFGSDQPITPKPKAPEPLLQPKKPTSPVSPGQLSISDIKPPEKPPVVNQADVSKQAAKYRASQEPVKPTPSTPPKNPAIDAVDVKATEVSGTKFAEPPVKPKQLPGLNLGTEPAGKMVPVRPGESETIKPQVGPGRTGVLGKPRAGQMAGARIEPVRVVDITSTKPKISGTGAVKTTPVSIPAPPKPEIKAPTSLKPVEVSTSKPVQLKAPSPAATKVSTADIGKTVSDVLQKEREAVAAEKAAKALDVAKSWRTAGRIAGVAGAGLDAYSGYKAAREEGSSKNRAIGAGIARAAGGLLGGAAGSTVGSVLGLPGAVAGGVAGYGAGTELGTKVYNTLTGDPGKKLTTQGFLSNVRRAVPQEIRSNVPEPVRKGFKDFVTQTGKMYGSWQQSQQNKK